MSTFNPYRVPNTGRIVIPPSTEEMQRQLDLWMKMMEERDRARNRIGDPVWPRVEELLLRGPELPGRGRTVGYLTAWRLWNVRKGHLTAYVNATRWPKDRALEAIYVGLRSPVAAGIYACKGENQLLLQHLGIDGYPFMAMIVNGEAILLGRVALWGHVVEHEKGYRAQYAYPLSINAAAYTDGDTIEYLCNEYKIPYQPDVLPEVIRGYRQRRATQDNCPPEDSGGEPESDSRSRNPWHRAGKVPGKRKGGRFRPWPDRI